METLYDLSAWVIPLILAITLHEAAHGFVAHRLGDDTALRAGRVTFNPFKHIDRFGTILLPGLLLLMRSPVLFGYAKPVPVNFSALRSPRRDGVLVALAGPGTNILLAFFSGFLLYVLESFAAREQADWVFLMLYKSIIINVVLAVFNMLPVPPLDGGRVLTGLLPASLAYPYSRLERFGIPLVMLLLILPALLHMAIGVYIPVGEVLIGIPADFLMRWILVLTGNGWFEPASGL